MQFPSSPVFLLLVLITATTEFYWRDRTNMGYDLGVLGGTVGVAFGQFVSRAATSGMVLFFLMSAYELAPIKWSIEDWRVWAVGFVAVEFAYYWQHRFSHTVRWFWTSHAVHHSSPEYTLPAAVRLGWTGPLTGLWIFFIPLALAGLHPIAIGSLLAFNLNYQYFLHTELIGRLGPVEWLFNTPSHHRVHHASNEAYLDKNFGGVLIVFDRMFGSFAEEPANKSIVYGLTKPVLSNNPVVIALHETGRLIADLRQARTWKARLSALFGRPAGSSPVQTTRA